MSNYNDGPFDFDNFPEFPDPPDYEPEEQCEPGAFIDGKWVDVEDLPRGYGNSPEWWDDDCGETYEEYLEHED